MGVYPTVRLADARLRVAEFKLSLREGIDPKKSEKEKSQEFSRSVSGGRPLWRDVAQDYLMLRQRSGAAPRTMAKLDRQIGVTVAHLGDRTLEEIKAEDVLSVVNPIAERGHVENAHEIRSRFSQIFRYAAARGLVDSDPAALTIGAMIKRRRGEFPGLTDPKEVGQLMRDSTIAAASDSVVKARARLCGSKDYAQRQVRRRASPGSGAVPGWESGAMRCWRLTWFWMGLPASGGMKMRRDRQTLRDWALALQCGGRSGLFNRRPLMSAERGTEGGVGGSLGRVPTPKPMGLSLSGALSETASKSASASPCMSELLANNWQAWAFGVCRRARSIRNPTRMHRRLLKKLRRRGRSSLAGNSPQQAPGDMVSG